MGAVDITRSTETYRGESYRLERRDILSFNSPRGYRRVWCWEVTSGPGAGAYGGKCATKAEARKVVRDVVRAWEAEASR